MLVIILAITSSFFWKEIAEIFSVITSHAIGALTLLDARSELKRNYLQA